MEILRKMGGNGFIKPFPPLFLHFVKVNEYFITNSIKGFKIA